MAKKEHKGLLAAMAKSTTKHSTLSEENVIDLLREMWDSRPATPRPMVLYTGQRGALVFDFTMKFGQSFHGGWWTIDGKHLDKEILFLSVVRKHSVYKVKVTNVDGEYKFNLYKGTVMTDYYNNITALNVKLEKLNMKADIKDCYTEYERQVRIAQRELDGKLNLIYG